MSKVATHKGVVTSVKDGKVFVKIESVSACASCEAKEKCGFSEKEDKIVEVETSDYSSYQEGDPVMVSINEGLGLQAVLLAYVLPSAVVLALILTLLYMGVNEGLSVLITLVGLAIYLFILYSVRDKLQSHFTFNIRRL